MIAIEISVKPHVAKYLHRLYGPEMKLSPRKDLVNRMMYYLMRDNLHEDRRYETYQRGYTSRYKVLVPKRLVIDRGARSLSAFCTSELNASIDELIKKEFYEHMRSQVAVGVMRRDAIYSFRDKHGFSEDELAFETLKKAFYRYELNQSNPLHAAVLALARPEGDNFGGLLALQLLLTADLLRLPEHDGVVMPTSLPLRSGAELATMEFTAYTASFSEDELTDEQGIHYQWKIPFSIPKNAPDIKYWLDRQRGRDLMAIAVDTNGVVKLVGTPAYPLKLKMGFDSGSAPGKKNAYDFTLTGESREWALFYQMYESLLPQPRKVFSSGFSFGFLRTP